MDEAAVRRGRPQRQQPVEQQHRHPHRRPALRPGLGPARRPRARGGAHPGAAPSSGWSPARSARPSAPQPGDDPVAHYLEVLADKTGSLVATSARFGATLRRGRRARWSTALTAFGEEVGVAFQLSDDLLDIVSEGGASGKSPGTDLREGIATLPGAVRPRRRRPGRGAAARAGRRARSPTTPSTPRRWRCCARPRSLARATERAARVRRPRPCAAGRRPGRRRPRRPVGAVRLRGDPHQLRRMLEARAPLPPSSSCAVLPAPPARGRTAAALRRDAATRRHCAGARGPRRPAAPALRGRGASPTAWTTPGTSSRPRTARCWSTSAPAASPPSCPTGRCARCGADFDDLFAEGETGLMGLALDPAFADNRRFYTCQGVRTADGAVDPGDRVDGRRRLDVGHPHRRPAGRRHPGQPGHRAARRLPARSSPPTARCSSAPATTRARHHPAGPRLARPARCCRTDPSPTGRPRPAVWTLRAPQRAGAGRAARHRAGVLRGARPRPRRRGEPAAARAPTTAGTPTARGGYDESVPMTDPDIPGAVPAVWSSGVPTLATSGATFLDGEQWGGYDGLLVIGAAQGAGRARAAARRRRRAARGVPGPRARRHLRPDPRRCARAPTARCTSPPTTAADDRLLRITVRD